ncbi:MAG TPA: hypothetical protein VIQ53_26100 [Inquilinus sp.]
MAGFRRSEVTGSATGATGRGCARATGWSLGASPVPAAEGAAVLGSAWRSV